MKRPNVRAEKRYNVAKKALSTFSPSQMGSFGIPIEHVNASIALQKKHKLNYKVSNNVLNQIVNRAKKELRLYILSPSNKLPHHILKKIANIKQ